VLKSADPRALLQRAVALHRQNQLAQAKLLYHEILGSAPKHIDALNLLGAIACQEGNFAQAVRHLSQVVALDPQLAAAHSNLGYALRALKRPAEALAACDQALKVIPDFADALNNRAGALLDLGRYEEALATCDKALALDHRNAVAAFNRGNAEMALDRPAAALVSYDWALAVNPGHPEGWYNRGTVLRRLDRRGEALTAFERAMALIPNYADALRNHGITASELGRHDLAAASFGRLLDIAQDSDYMPGDLLHARLHCGDWRDHAARVAEIAAGVAAGKPVTTPFIWLAGSDDPASQLRCARRYAAAKYPTAPPAAPAAPRTHERIRLAYLSPDFRDHPVAHQIAGLIEAHDRARFETIGLSFGPPGKEAIRSRLERGFGRFIDVREMTDRTIADLMVKLEIDIAVDLAGYTGGGRPGVLALRPAPVQVNFLGYAGTMGADFIDYLIADDFVIPPEAADCYAERIVRLPGSFLPYDTGRLVGEPPPTREASYLPPTGFVFCAFNNIYKVAPPVFEIWLRLLSQIDGSVLWLSWSNAVAERNLRDRAAAAGIDPERLIFAPRLPLPEHLARHRLADLMLDTLPYNAHTTAGDALWAGLPVVTCAGRSFAARVAGSLLTAAGLPELITETLEAYENLALALARNPARLAALKAKLARNRATCALFDTEHYRRSIESAYCAMWERHQRVGKPESFTVTA
jgi:predicted O-linked N-acetylglucosamine transferase (SPINDLY family)